MLKLMEIYKGIENNSGTVNTVQHLSQLIASYTAQNRNDWKFILLMHHNRYYINGDYFIIFTLKM